MLKANETRKKLIVAYGVQSEIAKRLRCGRNTVRYALLGISTNERADEIRRIAIEEYRAAEMPDGHTPIHRY